MPWSDSSEFLCLTRQKKKKKSEKLDFEAFYKAKETAVFFSSSLCYLVSPFLPPQTVRVLNGAFFTWIDILLVSVFYLLMCCRLKVGREDEPAH